MEKWREGETMREVIRFEFPEEIDREATEGRLSLAIVATECMFGRARVRLNAAYLMSDDGRKVAVDVSTDVGENIAQLFTGLLIRDMGEEAFSVERAERFLETA